MILDLLIYPAMMWIGLSTIKGRLWAVIIGTIFAIGWTILTLFAALRIDSGFLQLEVLTTGQMDPFHHFQISILLLLQSVIGAILYTAALHSKIREKKKGQASLAI
jgi:hypothetical protein